MTNSEIKVGTLVYKDGHEGVVTKVCDGQLKGMVEVRLDRGEVCVPISELQPRNA